MRFKIVKGSTSITVNTKNEQSKKERARTKVKALSVGVAGLETPGKWGKGLDHLELDSGSFFPLRVHKRKVANPKVFMQRWV